jgi:hypothetical protein
MDEGKLLCGVSHMIIAFSAEGVGLDCKLMVAGRLSK